MPGNIYFRVSYDVVEQTTSAQLLTATLQLSSCQTDEVSKVVDVVTRSSSRYLETPDKRAILSLFDVLTASAITIAVRQHFPGYVNTLSSAR